MSNESILQAHIDMLQRQNADLLAENQKLQQKLAAWPQRALEHALDVRERIMNEPDFAAFRAQRNADMGDIVREVL